MTTVEIGVELGAIRHILQRASVQSVDIVSRRADQTEVLIQLVCRAVGKRLRRTDSIGGEEANFAGKAIVLERLVDQAVCDVLRLARPVGRSVLVGGAGAQSSSSK